MAKRRKSNPVNEYLPSPVNPVEEMTYRARSALSTLAEAEQIRANKPLMREVKKLHTKQGRALGVNKRAAKDAS